MPAAYDVVVVGAGAMGSSAALAIARTGRSVVVLEQFHLGHERGGSHGGTRIFRLGTEEKEYLDLTERSRQLWRELEAASGEVLLEEIGAVEHGVDQAAVDQFVALLGDRAIPHEVVAPEDGAERWPGMRFDGPILFQPGGGRLYAARAVAALQRLGEAAGVDVEEGQVVQGIRPSTSGGPGVVEVVTDKDVFHGDRVVVTAGPWTPRILSGQVELPRITATREQPRHYAAPRPGARVAGVRPVAARGRPLRDVRELWTQRRRPRRQGRPARERSGDRPGRRRHSAGPAGRGRPCATT